MPFFEPFPSGFHCNRAVDDCNYTLAGLVDLFPLHADCQQHGSTKFNRLGICILLNGLRSAFLFLETVSTSEVNSNIVLRNGVLLDFGEHWGVGHTVHLLRLLTDPE